MYSQTVARQDVLESCDDNPMMDNPLTRGIVFALFNMHAPQIYLYGPRLSSRSGARVKFNLSLSTLSRC